MKKHLVLFIIVMVSFLTGCGAGGGVSTVDKGLTDPPPSNKAKTAKIKIKEDGIYKLTFSDLNTASLDLSGVTTASLKMTNNNEEIAINVIDTDNDGIFESGDSVEFYGKAISRGDASFRYTETNVYWLSSEAGDRIRNVQVPDLKVLHMEEDSWYEQKNYPEISKPDDVREHWFWGMRFTGPSPDIYDFKRSYTFSTYGFDKSPPTFSLKIRLQPITVSQNIKAYINDNPVVVDGSCEGLQPCDIVNSSINSSYLKPIGLNTLTIESVGSGLFYFDWFEVDFYQIKNDSIAEKIVQAYTPADLKSGNADYIIITHEDFYDAIKPLADYRSNQGYKVMTVKVKDIYDEFNSGIETPKALKDFLTYAYKNWNPRPAFVLLVGDATIDYKDVSGYGKDGVRSYIPAYLYNYYGLGEVPSDNWFVDVVDVEGNVLPEMNIGRIPAKTAADVTGVINKIKAHETAATKSNNVLLIADDNDNYDIITPSIFENLSNSLKLKIPADVTELYQRDYKGDFTQGIINAINAGPLVVNYTGHGSVVNWTKEVVFASEDVSSLSKNSAYPFLVALNCLNGYFVLPDDGVEYVDEYGVKQKNYPSISESFLMTPEKGAVAVLAASAIGYPSEHDPLASALYDLIFKEGNITLGEAVTKAKEGLPDDVVQTFIFFGDPATRLR